MGCPFSFFEKVEDLTQVQIPEKPMPSAVDWSAPPQEKGGKRSGIEARQVEKIPWAPISLSPRRGEMVEAVDFHLSFVMERRIDFERKITKMRTSASQDRSEFERPEPMRHRPLGGQPGS